MKNLCTFAGVDNDWINPHSVLVKAPLGGVLGGGCFIRAKLLADGSAKGKAQPALAGLDMVDEFCGAAAKA